MTGDEQESLADFAERVQRILIEEALRTYGPRVVDLWQNPKHLGRLEGPDGHARITGPCGDTMEVFLRLKDMRVAEAAFVTDGCGPTLAAGSTACELALGKPLSEARRVDQRAVLEALGGLPEESAHCAKLAADTLQAALSDFLDRGGSTPGTPSLDYP